jgi:hypothetical protein
MAVTAIWDVKDSLKRVLDYASNPEKTENQEMDNYIYQGLESVISYTKEDEKTHKQLYVSSLNCDIDSVYEEMVLTKRAFQKTEGILAFHGYQSFAPREVSAETAHQIGIELANELWGERFQVLVTTHLDKEHYHNHFVINSVSFVDGLRYYDNKKNYRKMRIESDKLCEKYKLSVIKEPKKKSYHYAEWQSEKEGRPTWRSIIRDDVDKAIDEARTYSQFLSNLKNMGYVVKSNVKHIAVKPQGKDRFVRLRSLSKNKQYDEDSIRQRILKNKVFVDKGSTSKKQVSPTIYAPTKLKGFKALYFHYMYLMGVIPEKSVPNQRVHFLFKEDLRHLDQITREVTIMEKKNIDTLSELEKEKAKVESKLEKLVKERRCVYNKVRRCRSDKTKELLQRDIATLSNEIKELRKEVRLYEGIKTRTIKMEQNIIKVKTETEEKEVTKEDDNRRRKRRSSR